MGRLLNEDRELLVQGVMKEARFAVSGAKFIVCKWLLAKALGMAEKYFRKMGKFLGE